MVKISEIAQIRAGYSFREAVGKSKGGDLSVVQFKDVGVSAISSVDSCASVFLKKIKPLHFLKFNDVLLSNRGIYKSSVFKCVEKSVATGVFFVLTIENELFLPEFVSVYLNSTEGQKQLCSRQNQSGVKAILRSELEQIDIPLIPLERQKKVVELLSLYQREVDIIEKIQQNRKKLVEFIVRKELKE